MSFRKKTFLNIFQLGGYSYIAQFLSFASSIVMARLLLPEEFGFVAMIMVITNFASILSGIGIGSDIIRSSYGYTYHKSMMNLSFYLGLFLCLVIILAAYPLSLFFGNADLIIPTLVISTKFIFAGLNVVYFSLIMKKQLYTIAGKINLYSTLLSIIIMILMAYLGLSYWSLIIPLIIAEAYKFALYYKLTKLKFKIYPIKYTLVAFKFAKSIMGSILGVRIISYWGRNLDNIMIGRLYGEASLGIYNRGYRFIDLISGQIERLFDSVLYPNLQVLKTNNGDVYKEYLFFAAIINIISYPISLILIVFPEALVQILWGNNWMVVADYLPYFGIAIMGQLSISNSELLYKLYYKDLLLFQIGVFRSIAIVIFIIIGSLYSPLMVTRMIAVVQVLVIVPVTVYFSFGKAMNFSYSTLNKFYIPNIFCTAGVLVSVWMDNLMTTVIFMLLYLIHLLIFLWTDIGKLKVMIMNRSLRKNKA
jgi:teichuronic acid exporter